MKLMILLIKLINTFYILAWIKGKIKCKWKRKYVMTYLEGRYTDITSKHVVSGKNSLDKFTPDFVAKDIENKEFLLNF